MKKKYLSYLGRLISVLSIGFIIHTILKFDVDFSILLNSKTIISVMTLAFIYIITIFIDSLCGAKIIYNLTKATIPLKKIYVIYSKANIGKYLPGNVMHYISRNIYAKEYNIQQQDMIFSTILEIILKVVVAFIIGMTFVYKEINQILQQINILIKVNAFMISFLVVGILISILGVVYIRTKKVKESIQIGMKLIKPMILYSVTFIINSTIFMAVIITLTNDNYNMDVLMYTLGIHTVAWLLGYITPGAPGGVGIKETIIIVMLGSIYGESNIIIASVISRIICVLGDGIAYYVGLRLEKSINKDS